MPSKSQWRVIFIAAAVIVLVAAFMVGIMNIMEQSGEVSEVRTEYLDFAELLSSAEQYEREAANGKVAYTAHKAEYDKKLAAHESELKALEDAEKQFAEDVMSYNTKLLEYSAGKTAMSSGKAALDSGRKQLEDGWKAYNEGKKAFEQGSKEAAEKLAQFEQGKAAYEEGVKQYEEGLAGYNKLMESINKMESMGVPHRLALLIISGTSGTKITDDSIAEMETMLNSGKAELDKAKEQIDAADAMMPDAQAQMDAASKQLDDTKKMLEQGETELDKAEEQLVAGQKQIDSIGSSIGGGQSELDKISAELESKRAELDKAGEELDAEKKELAEYEKVVEKLERRRESLIDEGYGTANDEFASLMSAAGVHKDELKSSYVKANVSFIVTYAAHMLAVALCVIALLILKKRLRPSLALSIAAAVLSIVGAVASLVLGSFDFIALIAAGLTLAGVSMTEPEA